MMRGLQVVALVAVGFGCGRGGFGDPSGATDAPVASARAAFDSLSIGTCAASPCVFPHTVGPGASGIILIWYFCANEAASTTGVAVDGVPAVNAGAAPFSWWRGELWYALASTSAVHTISASYSCTGVFIVATSAIGVDPADPIRAARFDGSELVSSSITDVIASASDDLVVDGVCHGSPIDIPGPPQTAQYVQNLTGGLPCGSFAGSSQPGASPWVTTAWSSSSNDYWGYMGISLRSAP
jgi:hypothetical protein